MSLGKTRQQGDSALLVLKHTTSTLWGFSRVSTLHMSAEPEPKWLLRVTLYKNVTWKRTFMFMSQSLQRGAVLQPRVAMKSGGKMPPNKKQAAT